MQCVWRQSLGEVGLERVNVNRKREGSRESKGLERKRKFRILCSCAGAVQAHWSETAGANSIG